MATTARVLVGLVLLGVAGAIRLPHIYLLSPWGLGISHPHEPGMTLFAVHYSINRPLRGVAAGQWNFDVRSRTGSLWIHENRNFALSDGDVVNYWIYILKDGRGSQITNQRWVAPNIPTLPPTKSTKKPDPTTTTSTTTKATTTTTKATTTTAASTPTGTTRPPVPTQSTKKPVTPLPSTSPPTQKCTSYPCLIFSDEFEKLDFKKWEHEITAGGGGNWEFQYYLNNRTNSYVKDNVLYLKPTLTSDRYGEAFLSSGTLDLWGANPAAVCTGNAFYGCFRGGNPTNYINPIQSARLRSVQSFNFRYGRVEVEAKLPKGDWIWPAIWMLPTREDYGLWPASGEIDIMESRGNLDLKNEKGEDMGHRHIGATLHWGPFFEANRYAMTTASRNGDFSDSFHTYGVEWDETSLKLTLDGNVILNVEPPAGGFWEMGKFTNLGDEANPWKYPENKRMAPFDKEFYILMNVAVGGTNGFFSDNWKNARGSKPWSNKSPTAPREFWKAKDTWYPTWNPKENNGEDAAMKVKSVRVWKMKEN